MMLVLGIIILILLIILLLPVGADAAYIDGAMALKVKLGPFRIGILPGRKKDPDKKKAKKQKKTKKPGKAKAAEGGKKAKAGGRKMKLAFGDIMVIIKLGLKALGRFRRSIRLDHIMVHVVTAGPDPYGAVMNYGYINAALGAMLPLLHRCFRIGREDYDSRIDFEADKLRIDAKLVLSVRIGEILLIALCAAFGFLRWFLRYRRAAKAQAKAEAKARDARPQQKEITENSSAEKGI